jgi:hypothetical protein
MPQMDFYIDEGVNGMHLVERREQGPWRGDEVQVGLFFKSRPFGDVSYEQNISNRSVFQLLLRKLGYHDVTARHFSKAVITAYGTMRNVLIYKL